MTQFHETRMGQRLFENTLPELVRQVSRLAAAVERLADLQEQAGQPQVAKDHDHEEDPPQR